MQVSVPLQRWAVLPELPGVYMLTYTPDGDRYIGVSNNLRIRVKRQLTDVPFYKCEAWRKRKVYRLLGYAPRNVKESQEVGDRVRLTVETVRLQKLVDHVLRNLDVTLLEVLEPNIRVPLLWRRERYWITTLQPELNMQLIHRRFKG